MSLCMKEYDILWKVDWKNFHEFSVLRCDKHPIYVKYNSIQNASCIGQYVFLWYNERVLDNVAIFGNYAIKGESAIRP